ncbi:MAG: glycosyltransferase family 2 protein [Nitrososphaerota archaeon]|nr:glycosyltransferase family 2 protein [Nitrososphaerota archaeon]
MKADSPISVVVTAHNEERFIERCLSSLLKQDIDFEIVVVDDGSKDRTSQVVETFVNDYPGRVRLIRLERNRGLGNARNIGVFTPAERWWSSSVSST